MRPATRAVHAGRPDHQPDQPLNAPITMASTFVAGGELEYGRYANPTWTAFETALGDLEGGRCLAFASGMGAISAVLDLVDEDQLVVAPRHSYNGTISQLQHLESRGRIRLLLVDITDTQATTVALSGASLLVLESPTNPAMEVVDLGALSRAAHEAGARVLVDNTFATPILQQPLSLGADLVVHSATKYIAGHSDLLMGAVVTSDDALYDALLRRRSVAGAIPGAFEVWLALRGLRTLPLRVERAQANAAELAERLHGHPQVKEVRYPGFGGMIALILESVDQAEALCTNTRLWVHATSLGGVESTLERRRRHSAEPVTIPESLVRLSVGIEDVEDLWDDLVGVLGALPPIG